MTTPTPTLPEALRQGHGIASEDGYFEARPQIDSMDRRKVFGAGFERGWEAALAAEPAQERIQALELEVRQLTEQIAGLRHAPTPQADSQPAPVLDMAVMQLAESVGLIGPASRAHDLHAAIQRFHDLICVNATIKAATMAAEVISIVAMPDLQDAVVLLRKYWRLCQEVGRGDYAHLDRIEAAAVAVQTVAARAQADSQPAPVREGEWINDAGRIKWLMWRVQDLEAKLAARAPADSVQEDAARYRWLREGNDAKHGAAWHVAVNLYGCEWDAAIDAARAQQKAGE